MVALAAEVLTPGAQDLPEGGFIANEIHVRLADDSDYASIATMNTRAEKSLLVKDGITAPGATAGYATFYVDTADGDLKVVFGDGVVKTISVDT